MTNNPYNLNWIPELKKQEQGTIPQKILNVLKNDILQGRLKAGMQLPPQRLLAWTLGLNLGTVNKAYSMAKKQGLVIGEIGRGSYVASTEHQEINWPNEDPYSRIIDFSDNYPCLIKDEKILKAGLQEICQTAFLPTLFQYQQNSARLAHKETGAIWLKQLGIETSTENLLITAGALHSGYIALMCLVRPGDLILSEDLTSQAIKGVASQMKLRLKGIETDRNGIIPEALEIVLKKEKVTAIYLVPNLQNPTTSILSLKRRQRIAELLKKYGVYLIEDDVFGALLEKRLSPISTLIPENSFYVTSVSKSLAPALRVGYLVVPSQFINIALALLRTTIWMTSPVMTELASRWIINGTANKILIAQRKEIERRYTLAKTTLGKFDLRCNKNAPHLWLILPEPWRASLFAEMLKQKGVAVIPADHFTVDRRSTFHAVRICLGTPPTFMHVREGLEIIRDILQS